MITMAQKVTRKAGLYNEDVCSDLILRVYEKGKEKSSPGYIHNMMVNSVINYFSKEESRKKYFDDAPYVSEDFVEDCHFVIPKVKNDAIEFLNILMPLNGDEKKLVFAMIMSDFYVSEASDILEENYYKVRRKWITLKSKLRGIYENNRNV